MTRHSRVYDFTMQIHSASLGFQIPKAIRTLTFIFCLLAVNLRASDFAERVKEWKIPESNVEIRKQEDVKFSQKDMKSFMREFHNATFREGILEDRPDKWPKGSQVRAELMIEPFGDLKELKLEVGDQVTVVSNTAKPKITIINIHPAGGASRPVICGITADDLDKYFLPIFPDGPACFKYCWNDIWDIIQTYKKHNPDFSWDPGMGMVFNVLLNKFKLNTKQIYHIFDALIKCGVWAQTRDEHSSKMKQLLQERTPKIKPELYFTLTWSTFYWIDAIFQNIGDAVEKKLSKSWGWEIVFDFWELFVNSRFNINLIYEFVIQIVKVKQGVLTADFASFTFVENMDGLDGLVKLTHEDLKTALDKVKLYVQLEKEKEDYRKANPASTLAGKERYCYVPGCRSLLASRKKRWMSPKPKSSKSDNSGNARTLETVPLNSSKEKMEILNLYKTYRQRHHCKRCGRAVCEDHCETIWGMWGYFFPKYKWVCTNPILCNANREAANRETANKGK